MHISLSLFRDCKYLDPKATCEVVAPLRTHGVDLREEYVNAFRTESYNDFCARVTDLTLSHGGAAALPPPQSGRHLVERLLEPDQPTTDEILAHAKKHCRPETHVLLSDYYDETSKASFLCGLLLSDVERVRARYRTLKATLHALAPTSSHVEPKAPPQAVEHYLATLSMLSNPFDSSAEFQAVQEGSADLLRRLESGRKKAKSRLRRLGRLKRAMTAILVVLTASTSVVGLYVALHMLLAMAALPALVSTTSSRRMPSTRWLARVLAQLDAATKGVYILSRDLDTIGRLVTRLRDEVDHMLALLRLCSERCERKWGLMREVVRQIWKADASFSQQLDELEQHLYLCFITINKVRCLVMREVLLPKTTA